MKNKDHAKQFRAKAATMIRLTEPCHGTGKWVIADSWFGFLKTANGLFNNGLYSIMLVGKDCTQRFS